MASVTGCAVTPSIRGSTNGAPTPSLQGDLRGRPLSPREYEALRLYAWLGRWQDVADALGISLQTVKNHCQTAYAKLDAESVLQAYRKLGWLDAPGPKAA